jgi:Na+/melibiose symporter-like transporter
VSTSGALGPAAGGVGTLDGAGAGQTALARPSWPTKLFFGFTAVVETTKFQIYEIFLIFYYSQVLGLKGSLAGLAVAIAIIADAVLDPLIGSYSDSFRGRFGRRHTLMFLAIIPTGIFVWLLFSAPAGLGQAGLFLWMLTLCLAVRVAGSFYSVPAAAVAAELTEDATQRAGGRPSPWRSRPPWCGRSRTTSSSRPTRSRAGRRTRTTIRASHCWWPRC